MTPHDRLRNVRNAGETVEKAGRKQGAGGAAMSFLGGAANDAMRNEAMSRGKETLAMVTKSKLALNGLALAFVGFFGILNVFNPSQAIISCYLFLFGARRLTSQRSEELSG